jgi:hypothetical protein
MAVSPLRSLSALRLFDGDLDAAILRLRDLGRRRDARCAPTRAGDSSGNGFDANRFGARLKARRLWRAPRDGYKESGLG